MTTVRLLLAAILLAVGVCPAFSQTSSGGLFGATRADVGNAHKLSFTFQALEGYDTALPADLASQSLDARRSGGWSTRFEAATDYGHDGKRLDWSGKASTAFAYFQSLEQFETMGHSGSLRADVRIPKGTLQLEQAAAYSPSYLYQLFPVDAAIDPSIAINPDYEIVQNDSVSYGTKAALSFGSIKETQFYVSGRLDKTDFEQQFDQQAVSPLDLTTYETTASVSRAVTSRGRVWGGYTYTTSEYGLVEPTHQHAMTIGVAYSPALSRTRRLELRAEVSPTKIFLPDAPAMIDGLPTQPVETEQFRLESEVSVTYPFRRNWGTTARYRRGVESVPVFGQPVMSDSAHVGLNGLPWRRVDVSASAGYASVESVYNANETLDTYTGEVVVRYAMKRWAALSATYLYYYYTTQGDAGLSPVLQPNYEQHGVRVGLVLFLQALGRR